MDTASHHGLHKRSNILVLNSALATESSIDKPASIRAIGKRLVLIGEENAPKEKT